MKKDERGAIMVEASISLVTFMLAIFTILTVVDICIAQAKISCAIDATAKEISQYSYLYGLTGLNNKKKELAENASQAQGTIDETIDTVGTIFNEIQGLSDSAKNMDLSNMKGTVDTFKKGVDNIKGGVGDLSAVVDGIKKDPKAFIFSVASLAGREALDYATSKAIAEPLCRAMADKHLKAYDGQSTDDFLRALRIVPNSNGSYEKGLDFSNSTLFLYGSDEISIIVKYKIKIVQFLPIKTEFTFMQKAVTKGWLGGDLAGTERPKEMQNNKIQEIIDNGDSLWLTDLKDRSNYIINRAITEHLSGYQRVSKFAYTDVFDPETNTFVAVGSSNLLYSAEGEKGKTVEDITDAEIKDVLDKLVNPMSAELDNVTSVTYKTDNGQETKTISSEDNVHKKVVLVIPTDPDLKTRLENYIKTYDSKGIEIELLPGYGMGARSYTVEVEEQENEES